NGIAHHEIAPLGERYVDQPAGGVEHRLTQIVTPMRRHIFRLLLFGGRGLIAPQPARRGADLPGLGIKSIEARHVADCLDPITHRTVCHRFLLWVSRPRGSVRALSCGSGCNTSSHSTPEL